ncbi:hypothetical protein CMQ_4893 [Grosmannia clavigera kw1407]|uniref:Uncharacterized protein n=1 Tax=Grosmannia clavigera (strain kw1407 / UAMH 11150) TaxID=655863 RepID=F0XTX0_GROCL|nr:uncharacterized protein CMQ_4893 [Grosmannia clavigera kw1407]EFW99041.1 hypothetical protein CMQ_4893 [Grosmannia clavigera kw1407]
MMGGILARQANEQEDELPDDDLPSAVGYGPYWDALVEATVEFDPENFERTDPRRHAAAVLDTPELLMMYAQSMGDSIPATRLKFMRMMCGYDEEAGEHLTGGRSNEPVHKRICVRKSKSKDQDANGKFAHRRRRQNYT